jgi:hypothetical protein
MSPDYSALSALYLGVIPILLVEIAWRWHLLGGLAILLLSPVVLYTALAMSLGGEEHRDVTHLLCAAPALPPVPFTSLSSGGEGAPPQA